MMIKASICPVCCAKLGQWVPDFCPVCGWECGTDITLCMSLYEFSQKEREEYNARLAKAQMIWQRKRDEEEKRKINEQEKERKLKETTTKCSALKTRISGSIQNQKWAESLKLLDEMDRLNAGDKWAAEQRRKIQEIQDSEQRELEARCSALMASINGSINQRQWTEAIELLDEYDMLKAGDSWSAEQRRKIQAFRDDERREAEERSNTLKSRIRTLVQQHQWPEALKLLDEYDTLSIGDSWSAEQRELIQDRMSFRSTPSPVPAPLPTPRPQQSHQDRVHRKSRSSYLWIFLVIGVVIIAAIVGIRNLGTVQRIMPVQDQTNENLDLSYFYLIPNHTYTYALVTGIQDDVITDGTYQVQTGDWVTDQITHEGNSVNGRVMTYTGSRQLLRDLERMYLGPEAPQNRGISFLSYIDNTDLDFSPTCNCFIQISTDVYLGYETNNGYSTKYLIYSEDKAVRMGGLVCSRDVISLKDSSNDIYRSSSLWRYSSEYHSSYWREKFGYLPSFNYQVVRYEAINDVPENSGIIGSISGTGDYGEYYEYRGVNDVTNWAVMFSKEKGIHVITIDASHEYVGSAYVLVDG